MRAIVNFHDGFNLSPGIHTDDYALEDTIIALLNIIKDKPIVSLAAGVFVMLRTAASEDHEPEIFNVERTGSYGIKRSFCENPAYWPAAGDQFGVVFVNIQTCLVEWWGGQGFDEGDYNAASVRSRTFVIAEG